MEFKKVAHDKDGGILELEYSGMVNYNVDGSKLEEMIDKFMVQFTHHNNMIRNVQFIRTILKDSTEKLLQLNYKGLGVEKNVKYENGELALYEAKEKYDLIEEDNCFITKYTPDNNLVFDIKDANNTKVEHYNINNISKRVENTLYEIDDLKHPDFIKLNHTAKIIVEMYKLFYNENPDFSSPNINIKIQTMLSILNEFNISLNDYYSFSPVGKKKIPVSISLDSFINELFPLGEIKNVSDPVRLTNDVASIIICAGETIREVITDKEKEEMALINLSKIIYAARYSLSFVNNPSEVAKYTDCLESEISEGMKIVKKINDKINNN